MSKVVPFKKVTDEITIREDGAGVVTLRGAARLVGVSHEAISQAFKSVNQNPSKLIKALLEEGFSVVDLAAMPKSGITDEAMVVISHYYGYQAGRHCKPKAKDFHHQLKKTGPRVTFRELKGVASEGLQPVEIADEITIGEDGVAIVSIRGAARLAGVSPSSIANGLSSVASTPNQMARMIMDRGFDGVALLEQFPKQGIPDIALGAILKYYAYKAGQWCTEEAERACEQFDIIGIRSFCYSVKGMVEMKKPQPKVEPANLQPQLPPNANTG